MRIEGSITTIIPGILQIHPVTLLKTEVESGLYDGGWDGFRIVPDEEGPGVKRGYSNRCTDLMF